MNFSSGKQFVKPPQRGIFPLDHDAECKPKMQVSSMVVWRCIPVREKDDVDLESDEVLLRCAGCWVGTWFVKIYRYATHVFVSLHALQSRAAPEISRMSKGGETAASQMSRIVQGLFAMPDG